MSPAATSRVKHVPANTGRSVAIFGDSIAFKYEPADNDDALLMYEARIREGSGVPPHTERNREAFYVLRGTLELEADGEPYRLEPGDFLCIQPRVLHALHNPGPGWLWVLCVVSPGSQHQRFFETLGDPLEDPLDPPMPSGPPNVARMAEVARECGIELAPMG